MKIAPTFIQQLVLLITSQQWKLIKKRLSKVNIFSPTRTGGGFKHCFLFIPWGNDPIWRSYFSNGLVKNHQLELDLLYHGCNDIVVSPVDCGRVRRNNFGMQHWIRVPIVWLHCPLDLWRRATCVVATMVGPLTMLLGEKKQGWFSVLKRDLVDGMEWEWCSTYYYVYFDSGLVALIEVAVVADEKTAMHYKSEELHSIWVQGKMFIFANHGSL